MLVFAAGILCLSIFLMIFVIPWILFDSSLNANPKTASIGVGLAIVIRLTILVLLRKFIRESRGSNRNRNGEYIGVGVFLIIVGLIYLDGAVAFFSYPNVHLVSILMFMSSFLDTSAAFLLFGLFFLKPQSSIQQ